MQLVIGNPTVGDTLRDFELPATMGEVFKAGEFIGKPSLLFFCPSETVPACRQMLLAIRDAHAQLKAKGVAIAVIAISSLEPLKVFAAENQIPFPIASDSQLRISTMHGALRPKDNQPSEEQAVVQFDAYPRTFLIGPDMRFVKIHDNPEPASHVQELLKEIDQLLLQEPSRRMIRHAPVLLIPNVFPRDFCQRLIQIWHEQGNEDSGFMKQVGDKTVGIYDYSHKIRRDHFMANEPELVQLKKYISQRVVPQLRFAFNYEVTRFEDFRIAGYDSSRGGYFRPHRDNTTQGTAHRRFAMSLLLNDNYGGGALRFPEYGLHEYRPEAGSAVIFSCSLLHEAMDVTEGQRFVLLSFFYGEKEAKMREEYNLRTGGEYRAVK